MSLNTFGKILSIAATHPGFFVRRREYIFVISHMRSYSSLLCHILGSHSEISGYAEMHQSYSSLFDLIRLKYKVYSTNNNQLSGRFVLDKILNNNRYISSEILDRSDVKVLFMLRPPEDTMKSIISMGKDLFNVEWYKDPEKVHIYYVERLRQIEIYARQINKRAVFIESNKVVDNTESTLESLARWLNLKQKLSASYSTFKFTAAPRFGDPSDFIKRGGVVKNRKDYSDIYIPPDISDQAWKTYDNCRKVLLDHCTIL